MNISTITKIKKAQPDTYMLTFLCYVLVWTTARTQAGALDAHNVRCEGSRSDVRGASYDARDACTRRSVVVRCEGSRWTRTYQRAGGRDAGRDMDAWNAGRAIATPDPWRTTLTQATTRDAHPPTNVLRLTALTVAIKRARLR